MSADRVSLTEGYEGAAASHRDVANQGESVAGLAKKQHGHTSDLIGQNKGSFATQAANGSTATANTFQANALLHTANAEGGMRFTRDTAAHEEDATSGQRTESTTLETTASDLHSKINRA